MSSEKSKRHNVGIGFYLKTEKEQMEHNNTPEPRLTQREKKNVQKWVIIIETVLATFKIIYESWIH